MQRGLISWIILLSLGAASPVYSACRELDVTGGWPRPAYAADVDATIEFFGHNFFQITSSKGTKIITDPVAPGLLPDARSHAGRDHGRQGTSQS